MTKRSTVQPRVNALQLAQDYRFTHTGNAERLVAAYGHLIRYCPPNKSWYVWDGKCWAPDRGLGVRRLAKRTIRHMDYALPDLGEKDAGQLRSWVSRSEAAYARDAMVKCAESELPVVVMPERLDAHPWLLNLDNGTLDLKTGELRLHDQADLITKLAPVAYDPSARDGRWDKFLADATGGDLELQAMLARAVFSSLNGEQWDKMFLFLVGPPDSGKTTFINAVKAMLGPYASALKHDALLKKTLTGGIHSDIASLNGKRFVSSVEIDQGRQLAEGLVKLLTGGEATIQVAFKHKNEFDMKPEFTLWLAANDVPKIRNEDESAWARFKEIPFPYRRDNPDPTLKDHLQRSPLARAAVLAWAMRAREAWLAGGIGAASVVEAASAKRRADQDPINGFLQDECEIVSGAWAQSDDLWTAYTVWCIQNGEQPIGKKSFWTLLESHGLQPKRRKIDGVTRRGWEGVRL